MCEGRLSCGEVTGVFGYPGTLIMTQECFGILVETSLDSIITDSHHDHKLLPRHGVLMNPLRMKQYPDYETVHVMP